MQNNLYQQEQNLLQDTIFQNEMFCLSALNQNFKESTPQEILTWCFSNIKGNIAITSSFNNSALIHMLYGELNIKPSVLVIFIDTLHHFQETIDSVEFSKKHYLINLSIYQNLKAHSREEFANLYGDSLWEQNIDLFHHLTKVEPLQRALTDKKVSAWITGRRKNQSESRKNLPIFERDSLGRMKINPLANWDYRELWKYIVNNSIPYNKLHDQGYTSIGDEPLTTPTEPGESERAGRWRGSSKSECGIHSYSNPV